MSRGNCISSLMRTMVRPASFGLLAGVTRTHPKQWGRLSGLPGVTGWSNSKNTKINTTVRAFQTKHVSDPACPIVRALRSEHFAICINTTRVVITIITALLLQGCNMAVMAFQITGPSTGSGNGLASNRRQDIAWTNETSTLSHWRRNHL